MELTKLISKHTTRKLVMRSVEDASAAAEIFIAETYARLYFNQILPARDFPGLMSSHQFLAWVNDHRQSGRPGLLQLYVKNFPQHFSPSGRWYAIYLPVALSFAREKLSDKDYVRSAGTRALAKKSFENEEWVRAAAGVFGVKMLEFLAERGALRTEAARAIVEANRQMRQIVREFAAVVNRARRGDVPEYLLARIEEMVRRSVPVQVFTEVLRKIDAQAGWEYRRYQEIKPDIVELLREVARQSSLQLPEQLELLPSGGEREALPGTFWA
ncbi:hypothetical protein Adeg_0720 [Ammonifex degensii KC4]|uniref:Uncharacterized protein n=1 Tax=Ammonifex degensii (strain DSM 10501 / KC4) TaxID=429009 RepID=C9RC90_AMMDK|nr:hypothetical protein [Ammonifex degensii]ACX51867.1 hypothetical protein Adeg_0720 [Ammonifex degensii KC4]